MISEEVTVIIDRPYGSKHPQFPDIIYEVNYGYIEGVIGGDGEEQDCYVLGLNHPIEKFTGRVIAIIEREDDIEEKWVVANRKYTIEEIKKKVNFMEQYFVSKVTLW